MPFRSYRRRTVIKIAVLLCVAATEPWRRALGAEPDKLDVKDATAVALGYVEHASEVDLKKYPTYIKGSMCENCAQLQGTAGNNYRPCSLFPGKLVAVSGWCSGWAVEM